MGKTLFEKIWESHIVVEKQNEPALIYIDRHLVHEVTSPQAFDGLRMNDRKVRRPDLTIATMDHNVPTSDRSLPILDQTSAIQIKTLEKNCEDFGIKLFDINSPNQGIVHVIGPQLGITLPGSTIVCGDSHTSTHGAFGALALGIGTSEVEHVLASQTLWLEKPKTFEVRVEGKRKNPHAVTAKDIILSIIKNIGTAGGTGTVIEYRGEGITDLSMEQRMTICNMSIEAGAKAGLIAPDETTFEYLKGRLHAPSESDWDLAVEDWLSLSTDKDAEFDKEVILDGSEIVPHVSWGTNPGQVIPITDVVPAPDSFEDPVQRESAERALEYMGLSSGTQMRDIKVDTVFIGSCTNGRIEDLRAVAEVAKGRKVSEGTRTLVVPGSWAVKAQAENEGIPQILEEAGFDWREPGCSMCLAMNPDKLVAGERCASTSNRNFEGRQGRGGRTHLVSPAVAAATAIAGSFATPEDLS